MTEYDSFLVREQKIWSPFGFAMRFTDGQAAERVVVFGIYSGAYRNGYNYLTEWDVFELALIVDTYNQGMARLDADEQNTLLNISTKRYLEQIETLIHQNKLATEQAKLDAKDEEWDAKFAALEADRDALLTLQARYEARQREIAARIQTLNAQLLIEGVSYQQATAEVLGKELDVERAENSLSAKDVDIAAKQVAIAEKEVQSSAKDVELSGKDVELSEKTAQIQKLELAEAESEIKTLEIGNQVLRIQLGVVEAALKKLLADKEAAQMDIQSARYAEDIARTSRIEAELSETQVQQEIEKVTLAEYDARIVGMDADIAKENLKKRDIDMEYLNTDKQIAGAEIDRAQTIARGYDTDVMEADKSKADADYSREEAELDLYDADLTVIQSRTQTIANETVGKQAELTNINNIHEADKARAGSRQTEVLSDIENNRTETLDRFTHQTDMEQAELDLVNDSRPSLEALTDLKIEGLESDTHLRKDINKTMIAVTEQIMEAEIRTTLKHSIGKSA